MNDKSGYAIYLPTDTQIRQRNITLNYQIWPETLLRLQCWSLEIIYYLWQTYQTIYHANWLDNKLRACIKETAGSTAFCDEYGGILWFS